MTSVLSPFGSRRRWYGPPGVKGLTMTNKLLKLCAVLAIPATLLMATTIAGNIPINSHVSICSPISATWQTVATDAAADGTAVDATPYRPTTAAASPVDITGYTGVVVRLKYPRGETLDTDPVVCLWGLRDTKWCALKTSGGALTITLSDAASDCDDGTTYKWTAPSDQVDAIGCHQVVATFVTAADASADGAVSLELAPF